jgi:hypothetical protein
LYNIPALDKKHRLIRQNLEENGAWGQPEEIDVFNPLPSGLFEIQHVSAEHALVFYRSEAGVAGYREITPTKTGEFINVQRQAENILSYSFLTDTEAVHTLCIIPGMFASRLVYRRKESGAFESPIVLWESSTLEKCLLLKALEELFVFFHSNGNLYVSKSLDNGLTFSKPDIYRNKICKSPARASYVTYEPMVGLNHACRDVFVDSNSPWDIQILPELCEDFYPYESPVDPSDLESEVSAQRFTDEAEYNVLVGELAALNEENANNKAEITRLKQNANDNELRYTAKLNEKDDVIRNFETENEALKDTVGRLRGELDDMRNNARPSDSVE